MGPAPMIRMVEMSVLLGINSRGLKIRHKKRARCRASLEPRARVTLARGWSLEQISHRRKGFKAGIDQHLAALSSRCVAMEVGSWRPSLDLNQDKEHCTAPAS